MALVQLMAIDPNWRHKNGAQEIPSILAEEASIDPKPPLLIVLYPLYYLVIELSSRENKRPNSIESKWRSYSLTNSEKKIPYIESKGGILERSVPNSFESSAAKFRTGFSS